MRERFLQESPRMRLGHLASDLVRITSFIQIKLELKAVKSIMQESQFFVDWTIREVEPWTQKLLSEIQRFVAQKELELEQGLQNEEWKNSLCDQLRYWSQELLEKAGFLNPNERS